MSCTAERLTAILRCDGQLAASEQARRKIQPVSVDRTSEGISVISEGLSGGETVVVDGQLLLSDGTRVEPRAKKAGA